MTTSAADVLSFACFARHKFPKMDSEYPVITIAGVAAVGKKTIAARLLGLAEGHEITFPCPWTLDTKYYTANVQIRAVSVSHDVPCSAQLAGSEALLLVFDVTDEQSVQSLQRWIQEFNGDLPEVCLMLANRVDLLAAPETSSREQSWHEQAQDWCCQNYFEYIEVSAVNPEVDASLSRDGDSQGIRRIVSALQAHTWPGLRMKPQSGALSSGFSLAEGAGDSSRPEQPVSLVQFHSSAAATLEHSPRDSSASAAAGQHQSKGAQASTSQEAGSERGGEGDSAHASEHHSAAASVETPHSNGNATESSQGTNLETSDSEEEEDGGLEDFDSMLRRVQQGRSQLQGLPDDERRARAASMAAEMMQVLGIHEEDSDSDSPA